MLAYRAIVGLSNHTLLVSKDGTERPIADSEPPILDENGNILGVVLVFRDVTDAHRAQTQIAQSEKRFRRIFDTAHVAIWEQDFSDAAPELLKLQRAGLAEVDGEWAERLLCQVHTVDVNAAAVQLFDANDKLELLGSMARVLTPEAYNAFAQALALRRKSNFFSRKPRW